MSNVFGSRWFVVLMILLAAFLGTALAGCGGGDDDDDSGDDDSGDDDDDSGGDQPPEFDGATGAEALNYHSVRVVWDEAEDDETDDDDIRYSVFVSDQTGAQDFEAPAAASGIGMTEAIVTTLAADTEYFFVVRATDGFGKQETNEVEVSTVTEPLPPSTCGGTAGGNFSATLTVTVVDEGCSPIQGATVWLDESTYADTDAEGTVVFEFDAGDKDSMTVSAGHAGYSFSTWFGVDVSEVTLVLNSFPGAEPDLYMVDGTVSQDSRGDLPQADNPIEDIIVMGLVMESLSKETLLSFDVNRLLGPNQAIEIPGVALTIDLPSNIWIPRLTFIGGIYLEQDPFSIPLVDRTRSHSASAFVGGAYMDEILRSIDGENLDVGAIISSITPFKVGVIRNQTLDEGDSFTVPLDHYLADLSGGLVEPPFLFPVYGELLDIPSNAADADLISILGADLGEDEGLVPMGMASGDYPVLTAARAEGEIEDIIYIGASIATVSQSGSPYTNAFSAVLSAPDFGGALSRVHFDGYLNYTALDLTGLGTRTFAWEDVGNAGLAPELTVITLKDVENLNEFDEYSTPAWTLYAPGNMTEVAVPEVPAGSTLFGTDRMVGDWEQAMIMISDHVALNYDRFPLVSFINTVTRVSGIEETPE